MASGSTFKKNRGKYSNNRKTKLEQKIEKLKKPGKTYTAAQLLALKRKALNKSIADVKAENEKSMRDRARERNKAFREKKNLKVKNKTKKKTRYSGGVSKVENQAEKNVKIIKKKKNFLSNIK